MSFATTEKHEALRAKVREFAEAEVKPFAMEWDQENKFPRHVV